MSFAETFKALSDPVRREILELLKNGRLSAGDIASNFDMTQATVSYHLKILKKAGLVDSVQAGTSNIYYITFSATTDLLHQLTSILYKLKGKNE